MSYSDNIDRIFQLQWFAARIFNAAYIVLISFFLTHTLCTNNFSFCSAPDIDLIFDLISLVTFVFVALIGSLTIGAIECTMLYFLKRSVFSKKAVIPILASFISPAIVYPFIFMLLAVLNPLGHSFIDANLRTLYHLTSIGFTNLHGLLGAVLNTLSLSALFFMFILFSAIPLWLSRFLKLGFEPKKEGDDIFRLHWNTLNWQEIGSYVLIFITVAFVIMALIEILSDIERNLRLTSTDFGNSQDLIEAVLVTLSFSALFFMFILFSAIPLWLSRFLKLGFEPKKEGDDVFRLHWNTLNWQEIGSYILIFITVAFVVMFLLGLASESFLNEVFSGLYSGI